MWKKRFFRMCLILVLVSSAILCLNSLVNYSGKDSTNNSVINQRSFSSFQRNQPDQNTEQGNTKQFQRPDRAAGEGNASGSNQDGRMGFGNRDVWGVSSNDAAKYAPQLIAYTVLFFGLFITAYYYIAHKKIKIDMSNMTVIMLVLFGVGLFLRIMAATLVQGHPYDLNTFRNWAASAANNLFQVYSDGRSSDYPPLYMYVLFLIGKAASISAVNPYFTILLKLPSIFADIATALLIYKLAKKYLTLEMSVLVSAFYIFNPAVFVNSTFWGQVDSFFTLFVVSAILLLSENKIGFSAVLFAAAVLMKPQGIIFVPILFFELIRRKSLKDFVKAAVFALGTAVAIVLPFAVNKGPMWIFNLYLNTVGEYQYASVNAFNYFSLLGANYTNDSTTLFIFSYHTWGMIAIVLAAAFSWFIYIKGRNKVFASAAALLLIAGVFDFSSRMHERYLFPAIALAVLVFIYLKDKRLLLLAAGFSLTVYINTQYVLYETGMGVNSIDFDPVLMLASLMNVFLFGYLVKVMIDIVLRKKVFVV